MSKDNKEISLTVSETLILLKAFMSLIRDLNDSFENFTEMEKLSIAHHMFQANLILDDFLGEHFSIHTMVEYPQPDGKSD